MIGGVDKEGLVDKVTWCYRRKDGKWQCAEGASAQKPPRSRLEAKEREGSAGLGGWKVILEKEAILKSCGGCKYNRGLRFHYLLIFLCVYVYTYMLCVWGCTCVCEHWCGCEKMTCVIVCILKQGLSLAWSLLSRLGWLASEPQGSACPCFPSTGIASIPHDA